MVTKSLLGSVLRIVVKIMISVIILLVGSAGAEVPVSDGFDYPVGAPDGIGYGVEGYGGLAFLEKHDYQSDGYPEYHPGEDWNDDDTGRDWGGDSNDKGDPVYAISNGIVKYAQNHSAGWGYLVLIEHESLPWQKFTLPNGKLKTTWSQYGHLASINLDIQSGQPVKRGQQIGTVGDYPHGSGKNNHLHFEIRIQYRDPWAFVYNTAKNEFDYQPWPQSRIKEYYTHPSNFISLNRPQLSPLVGDWNGNGIDDTGTFNPRTSKFSWVANPMGELGDIPIIGDWNGDGIDTIGVYRPKTTEFFLDNNNDGIPDYLPVLYENFGDYPIIGDWDGDGKDDIGVFRSLDPNTSKTTFFLKGIAEPIKFGIQTDIPIIGDWNNDGIDEIGVFRRNDPDHENNAVFYLRIGAETVNFSYGNNDDIPIAGKPENDGLTRIGVYRPSTQQFIFNHDPLFVSSSGEIAPIVSHPRNMSPNDGGTFNYITTKIKSWFSRFLP